MISGKVRDRQALIRIRVIGPTGRSLEIEAAVDTGFTGYLTLPPKQILTLGLQWIDERESEMADGRNVLFDLYDGAVEWNGVRKIIHVEEVNTFPLLGMRMLERFEVNMQVRHNGRVTIRPLNRK